MAIAGFNAVVAALERHPERVKRLFFNARAGRLLGRFSRQLASQKKIYRQVEDAELARVAGSVHHGGAVVVVEQPPLRAPSAQEVEQWAAANQPLLLLDNVGNSHNLGALARTAAFFGLPRLILGGTGDEATPGPAAYRVAEGGLEHVECFRVGDLASFCRQIGGQYRVTGTALDRATELPPADAIRRWREPVALVLGNEEAGIRPAVRQACREVFRIPGSGRVESLNVSSAAAILMYLFFHDKAR